jgi:hypothetical protein
LVLRSRQGKSPGNLKLGSRHCHLLCHYISLAGARRHASTIESKHRKTIVMNVVLVLTLSAATFASVPVSAVEQEKDRCVLKEDPTEKIADCNKVPRKNAFLLDEWARKKGLIPER